MNSPITDLNGRVVGSPPASPMVFRPWSKFSSSTPLKDFSYLNNTSASVPTGTTDSHSSHRNDVQGTHSYPIFASTTTSNTPAGSISNFAENELIAWQQVGAPAPILRFGHTFNSGLEPHESQYGAWIAFGSVSSTGRFYMFTTDGEGTLGNTDGVHSSCTPSEGTCRSDVFILNLASPPATNP